MNLLVLTNEAGRMELETQPFTEAVKVDWMDGPGNIPLHSIPRIYDACIDLLFDGDMSRVDWMRKSGAPLIAVNAVGIPLSEIGVDLIRINAWPTFLARPIMEAVSVNEEIKLKAAQMFEVLGRRVEWVPDIKGMISPRIICSIINEAFFSLDEKISTEEEIDTAMRLGTNYPYGPFEWGRKIGLPVIYNLLIELGAEQARYRPSALLKQMRLA